MGNWIKLFRKLREWEWYKDSKTLHLFIHLLLTANYRPSSWRGHELMPGQLVSGRKQLAAETGLSEQSIRTSLQRLKSTSDLTTQPTNQFTIYTLCNYSLYQCEFEDGNQPANQPERQQLTTSKNIRKKEESSTNVELIDSTVVDGSKKSDSCPHREIIHLYHETLPELRRVRVWKGQREAFLRSRWREDIQRQNLDWWKGFFEYVRGCPWLMGTVDAGYGRKPFQADLEWLVRPQNFVKVVEGKYAQ